MKTERRKKIESLAKLKRTHGKNGIPPLKAVPENVPLVVLVCVPCVYVPKSEPDARDPLPRYVTRNTGQA